MLPRSASNNSSGEDRGNGNLAFDGISTKRLGKALICLGSMVLLVGVIGTAFRSDGSSSNISSEKGKPAHSLDYVLAEDRSTSQFMSKLRVVPYGVLGNQIASLGGLVQVVAQPDASTAVVDPAGLPYIQRYGPSGAGGASGALYKWLGIANDDTFPADVRSTITSELEAKFHSYGQKKVIHAVGPDLNQLSYAFGQRGKVVKALATVYRNILAEFAQCGLERLRLLPVSAGIFGGEYRQELPKITSEALRSGFQQLNDDQKNKVLGASSLELCIFMERDFQRYARSVSPKGIK